MSAYLTLSIAILAEIVGTLALKSSQGFTRLAPTLIVILGYGAAFYFLSLTLRSMPVGTAYAIWSGAGIVLISTFAWIMFDEKIDLAGMVGLGLIVAGILVVNLLSKTTSN